MLLMLKVKLILLLVKIKVIVVYKWIKRLSQKLG